MNEFTRSECAHPGNVHLFGAGHEADDTTAMPLRRYLRWGRIAAVALVAAAMAWAIGSTASKRIEDDDIEICSPRQPPLPGFPKANRTVDNNNMLSRLGLVPNLDGTAVAYTAEADRLISYGRFRTDLRLDQLAALLKINPGSIENPRSPSEIDPDAELFRAQAGTLTQNARARSRDVRKRRLLAGQQPDAVFAEWVVTDFSFTLNRLKHPNDEERIVLSAMIRAATGILPTPVDKIRATGANGGDLEPGRIALTAGLLPLETREQAAGELHARH